MYSYSVLFVCLGNICRSPLAEGVFIDLIKKKGCVQLFNVESAGTAAYHVGNKPDSRSRQIAKNHGVELTSLARQVSKQDFYDFDFIVAMDESNLSNLKNICPKDAKSKLVLMRDYDEVKDSNNVPDPYYGDLSDFEEVFQIVSRSCSVFLNKEFVL